MKVKYFDVYEVSFSLGLDPDNVVVRFHLIGEPTVEKISAFLESRIKPHQIYVPHSDGLPDNRQEVVTYYQCLFLLREQGMPELNLAKQYRHMGKDMSVPDTVGHLSVMKVSSIAQVVG